MKYKFFIVYLIILGSIGFSIFNCTEKFELETEDFEDVLVVEATITDELKRHEIKISRTHLLEKDTIVLERNATVKIETSNQDIYNFQDTGNGLYVSDTEFQVVKDVLYKLVIETVSGKKYVSNEEVLPAKASITNLYSELVDIGNDSGVQIFVDTNENLGEAQFFRYEYEETYKIIAPFYTGKDTEIFNLRDDAYWDLTYGLRVYNNPKLQEVCYTTNYSNIILTNTEAISRNRILRFPIRFTSQDNLSVFRERYSILVRQYVQSANAYNFYRILKELGGDVSLLLDNQPGYIKGNINSQQSKQEKVIGYFDVSSVDSKRIYFDYQDLGIDFPYYFYDCDYQILDYALIDPNLNINERVKLFFALQEGGAYLYNEKMPFSDKYAITKRQCADCSTFSSSIKPEFWED
ncbi:DUF4249 domain-containing protein [Thalassobellus sediminis]|uniref:DUF4249 domain-containing protein n=1 Tax=Thalassobellus sediminis TaxID=3367753 RepID=UPI0037945CF0